MKAILINPKLQTINEIKLSPLPTIFSDEDIARAIKNHD